MTARWKVGTVVAVILVAAVAGAQPPQESPAPANEIPTMYETLLGQLERGNTNINYTVLRLAFTETDQYMPYDTSRSDMRERMRWFLSREEPEAAYARVESLLVTCYVDVEAHYAAAIALTAMGDTVRSAYHEAVGNGLFESLTGPPLDWTAETAPTAIFAEEEYFVIRMMGLELIEESMATVGGRPFHQFEINDPISGGTRMIYFHVGPITEWWDRFMEEEGIEPESPERRR